jgi:hypothetical protein
MVLTAGGGAAEAPSADEPIAEQSPEPAGGWQREEMRKPGRRRLALSAEDRPVRRHGFTP